jgi:mannosyl-3-phosphoglycerate phosphatase
MEQKIVFTDLDGTLLDHDTYDFTAAKPVLDELRSRSIPVIICSSKTRAEIEIYRKRMNLNDPFITENGAAIFLPGDELNLQGMNLVTKGPYRVIELGVPYADLCAIWNNTKKKENLPMEGFSEMTTDEITAHTNLSSEEARLAAKREYSEPFLFSGTSDQFDILDRQVQEKGLTITKGGRFFHLIGPNDKGRAVEIVAGIYANTYPDSKIRTVGLGDSANDIPMLQQVDIPVVIRKKTGEWERIEGIDAIYSDKPAPQGWADSVLSIL